MERRGFLQALGAGAAMIMLPSLASATIEAERVFEFPMNTTADLTAWMKHSFRVTAALPAAFMVLKPVELAEFGVRLEDVPKEKWVYSTTTDEPEAATFRHFVMAYGVEGDDPVEAEKRLVQAVQEELSKIEGGIPLFLRVEPQFSKEQMVEYGDTFMTWEQIHDKGFPETLPDDVEVDAYSDSLKYVKRRYTLNKLRLRLSFPTLPEEKEEALCTIEGLPTKRI
jgi:hypothetical protein